MNNLIIVKLSISHELLAKLSAKVRNALYTMINPYATLNISYSSYIQTNLLSYNFKNINLKKIFSALVIVFLLIFPVLSTVYLLSPQDNKSETKNIEVNSSHLSNLTPDIPNTDPETSSSIPERVTSGSEIIDNNVEEEISEAVVHFEYPKYDLITTGLIQVSIQTTADLTRGQINIWSVNQEMELDAIVAEASTITANDFYIELEEGLYQIEAVFDTSQISEPIHLLPGNNNKMKFIFASISFDSYDFEEDSSIVETISVIDKDNLPIWGPVEISENQDITLIVKPEFYTLVRESGVKQTIDASEDIVFPLRVEQLIPTSGLQLNQGASFGELTVNSSTVDDMPLQSVTTNWYNASDYAQSGIGSSNSTGFTTFSLAPGVYDIRTYFSLQGLAIWNMSVVVTGGFDNVVDVSFSHLHAYTSGNQYVNIYNGTDSSLLDSQYSGGDGIGDFFVPGNQNYTLVIGGVFSYNHNVGWKERLVIGTKVNQGPTFTSISSTGRINANETTTVFVRARDLNYDYPLQFYISQNVGTVSISPGHWTADETWGIDVEFTAPVTDEFYQLDIGVEDVDGLFANHTLYLSNRKSDVTLRNVVADFQPVNLYSGLYSVLPDINYAGYSGSDGNNTFLGSSGVFDGLYRIQWHADNIFITNILKIDASVGSYFFQYNWTQITFNITAEWGTPVGMPIKVYNGSNNLVDTFVTKSTSPTTGLVTATLSPNGNYSIEASGSNSLWKHNINVNGGILYKLNYSFGGIAVYTQNLQNRYVYLYNGTNMNVIFSTYTGGDGIYLFRVSTYTNYTIEISGENTWIANISVVVGDAVAVGEFTNTAPTISLIGTSPGNTKVNANENVTMVITATDIDPVDFLTYTWSANVGTFIGTGDTVLYVAPAVTREYRIDVLVEDQFGGNDTAYMYVSNRYSTINVANNKSDGTFNQYVSLKRNRDGTAIQGGYTGTDGFITFNNVPDEEYTVISTMNGKGFNEFLLANGSSYNFNFRFGDFVFNTTGGNSVGFAASIRIRDNTTNIQYAAPNTAASGLSSFIGVAPGVYNLEAVSQNSVWHYQIAISENELVNLEFKFAEIVVNNTQGYGRPYNAYTYLYNNSVLVNGAYSGSDGIQFFFVNPSGNYSVETSQDNSYRFDNIILTENELYLAEFGFGVLVAFSNDGAVPLSQNVYVYNATTNALILNRGTGSDGYHIFHLRPGLYDVLIGASEWYYDINLLKNGRISVGIQINNAPVIEAISSSPIRLNTNEQATITVEVDDIDYDYPSLVLSVSPNVGSITDLMAFHGFTATNTFIITFVYTAPSTLQLYQLDITVSDGVDSDSQIYLISNSLNTLHLHSNKGVNKPENTAIVVYDYQTGISVWSGSTGAGGYIQTQILDGWYNIRFAEANYIWFKNIFISGNQILNLTASFGELTLFASGVGGVPINAYTYVRNATDLSVVVAGYTGSDGELTYILAPGLYQVEVVQSTSVFFDIEIVGGSEILVGSEIPQLTTQPNDIQYIFGDTGHSITWGFSDLNPHKYNITKDGITVSSGDWNGSSLMVNVDGLQVGSYIFRLFVNDTYGYYNFDDVAVTVTSIVNPPDLSAPADITQTVIDAISVGWYVNGTNEDKYEVHENGILVGFGTWTNGSTIAYAAGPKAPGIYTYVITVNNTLGMLVQDTVIVNVLQPNPPGISGSGDETVYETETYSVTWTLTSLYPSTYEIYLNNVLLDSGSWTNGNSYGVAGGPILPGSYNYTILVGDTYGGSSTNTIWITVQDVPSPILSSPLDVNAYSNETITFEWTLNGIFSNTYQLYIDGVLSTQDTWIDGDTVNVDLGLNPTVGTYNYTLVISNLDGDSAIDTVIVTVTSPPNPTPEPVFIVRAFVSVPNDMVLGPPNFDIETVQWVLEGNVSATYQIHMNGTLVAQGTVPTSNVISFELTIQFLDPGVREFVLTVDQGSLGVISDAFFIMLLDKISNSDSSDSPFSNILVVLAVLGLIAIPFRRNLAARRLKL